MKRILRKFAIAAVFASCGTAFADEAPTWDFETIQSGTEYYIYNIGMKKFLNDNNSNLFVDDNAPTWTVSGNTIQSANGKYVRVWETHETTGVGVTKKRTYTFHATSWETVSDVLSNISQNGSCYTLANSVEDSYKYNALKVRYDVESHDHYLIVKNGGLNSENTSVSDDYGRWLFISKAQYDNKAKLILLNKEKVPLNNLIREAEEYLAGVQVPTRVTSALAEAIAHAKSIYSNPEISDEAIQAVRDEVVALQTVLNNTKPNVDKFEALRSAISVANIRLQALRETAGVPQTIIDAFETRIASAQNIYDTFGVDKSNEVYAESTSLNSYVDNVNSVVTAVGDANTAISAAQSSVESLVAPLAAINMVRTKIAEGTDLVNACTVDDKAAIESYTNELNNLVASVQGMSRYYTQSLADIKNASLIDASDVESFKEDIENTTSKDEIVSVVKSLQNRVKAKISTIAVSESNPIDVTTLVTNAGFEYGDVLGWHAEKDKIISTSGITGSEGDFLFQSGEWGLDVSSGHNAYQVILGLPVGSYELTAAITSLYNYNPSLTPTKVYLDAKVVSPSYFAGSSGNPETVDDNGITEEDVVNKIDDIMKNISSNEQVTIPLDRQQSQLTTSPVNKFSVNEEGSPVVIAVHSGLSSSFTSTYPYRMDNFKLAMTKNVWTGVEDVIMDQPEGEEVYFDLQGRRVMNPERGIYICNGRKVLK